MPSSLSQAGVLRRLPQLSNGCWTRIRISRSATNPGAEASLRGGPGSQTPMFQNRNEPVSRVSFRSPKMPSVNHGLSNQALVAIEESSFLNSTARPSPAFRSIRAISMFLLFIACLAIRAEAQSFLGTLQTATHPRTAIVNPTTGTLYVADYNPRLSCS